MTSRTPETTPDTGPDTGPGTGAGPSADTAIERFAVRRTDQGFGVWDAAVNGWHSRRDLDESTATALADGMNARAAQARITPHVPSEASPSTPTPPQGRPAEGAGDTGGTGDAGVPSTGPTARALRKVEPPRRVLVLIDGAWWPGRLDWWAREADGWYGRAVLDVGGPSHWYAASSLRPAP